MARTSILTAVLWLSLASAHVDAQGCSGQGNATLTFSSDPPGILSTAGVLGGQARATLSGLAGAPIVWAAALSPGSWQFPGFGSICLGLSPGLAILLDSTAGGPSMPPGGLVIPQINVPASLPAGLVVYSQFVDFDPSAPNGVAISNPASILLATADSYLGVGNTMASARGLHGATTFGGGRYVFLSGGGSGQLLGIMPTATTDVYDVYTRSFVAGPTMANARALHTSTLLADGRILVTGGINGLAPSNFSDGEVYDPATNAFTPVSNLLQTPRAAHTATLLANGQVLIAGGNTMFTTCVTGQPCCPNLPTFNSTLATTEIYDPATNMFLPGPMMPAARAGHEAVTLSNGSILLAGGIVNGTCISLPFIPPFALPNMASSAFVYNPATNSFATETGVTPGRIKPILQVLPSGNVFFGGGTVLGLTSLNATSSVLIRSAAAGTWGSGPSLPHAGGMGVAFAAAAMVNGAFVISGGGTGSYGSTVNLSPVPDVYRFIEGSGYTQLTPLPQPRMNHSINALADGSVLVAGGINSASTPVAVNTAWNWTP